MKMAVTRGSEHGPGPAMIYRAGSRGPEKGPLDSWAAAKRRIERLPRYARSRFTSQTPNRMIAPPSIVPSRIDSPRRPAATTTVTSGSR